MSNFKKHAILVSLAAAVALNVWTVFIPTSDFMPKICALISLAACLVGGYYVYDNFSKQGASEYKMFMAISAIVFAASGVYSLLTPSSEHILAVNVSIVVSAIAQLGMCACLLYVSFATDLGKQKSTLIANVCLAASVLLVISSIISLVVKADQIHIFYETGMIRNLSKLALAFVVKEMVDAKYIDKAARGSK